MIFFQRFGALGCRADGALATGTNAFAAADALINDTDGLLFFDPDRLGGAASQTRTTADTSVFIKTNKAG